MLSAAILAGGQATRFHDVDHSALVIEGRPILERQLAQLSRLTIDMLQVGGGVSHERGRGAADLGAGCGPIGGLHAALTEEDRDGGWPSPGAVYTRGCLARVVRRLAEGRLKLIDLLADLRVRAVPAEELDRFGDHHHLVANLNTPAEHRDFATPHSHGL